MDPWRYLALLAGCLLISLPLEWVLRARVYRRPSRLLRAVVPVALLFLCWDVIATARGHWTFNRRFLTGVTLGGSVPIEELIFFLVIPLCALLTFEGVGTVLSWLRGQPVPSRPPHARRRSS